MKTAITLPVSELKAILPGFAKVVAKRSALPILGCLRIEQLAEEISLTATDLDDHLQTRIAGSAKPTVMIVPLDLLAKAAKSTTDSIMLMGDGEEITLRTFAGDCPIDQSVPYIAPAEWPETPTVTDAGIEIEGSARQAIREAFTCSSEDESRLILNSAYLDVSDPKAHYVVGTNGRLLFSANSFQFGLKESLMLPRRRFLSWSAFWDEPSCQLSSEAAKEKGSAWVQFKTDRWTFITRQIDGNYPNWKQIIPSGSAKTTVELDAQTVAKLLAVLPLLPGKEQKDSPLKLEISQGQFQVIAKSNTAYSPVPVSSAKVTGRDVNINLNRDYLLKALQLGLSEIQIFDALSPLICQAGGKRLLIAPLRPDASLTVSSTPQTSTPTTTEEPQPEKTMTKTTENNEVPETAIKKVIDQIERIKETLKSVLTDFGDVLTALKTAEKEKKASEKEIESIRTTLRSLQKVQI